MKVLVTGASGFVGRALCRSLADQGHQVTAAVRSKNTDVIEGAHRTCIIGEIGPETNWSSALAGQVAIYHLAARAHVMTETLSDPEPLYRQINVEGTKALLKQAKASGVRRLIFLSSVKVNGESTDTNPYTEAMPAAPEDAYGRTKKDAEDLVRREPELAPTIMRSPLVYGPGVKGNFLKLLGLSHRAWPLPFGSIENKRSLIYLENLVDALSLVLQDERSYGQTYLVDDGRALSTPELIRSVSLALGRPSFLIPFPLYLLKLAGALSGRSALIDRLCGSLQIDSHKIRQQLGWKPPFSVEQGLEITAEWFQNQSKMKAPQRFND